jgi:ketosteroid isomerase-like protein
MRRFLVPAYLAVTVAIALALFSSRALAQSAPAPRTTEHARQTIIALENDWLAHVRDSATLERILAPDFVHAVAPGEFLTKQQHISWNAKHPLPPNHQARFEKLQVRLYGDVGIASGIVASSGGAEHGSRTLFTDVFAFRNGRWQAVHAQETSLPSAPGASQ